MVNGHLNSENESFELLVHMLTILALNADLKCLEEDIWCEIV